MRSFRSKPVGWQRDSYRHYLAAKYGSANGYCAFKRIAGEGFVTDVDVKVHKGDLVRIDGVDGVAINDGIERMPFNRADGSTEFHLERVPVRVSTNKGVIAVPVEKLSDIEVVGDKEKKDYMMTKERAKEIAEGVKSFFSDGRAETPDFSKMQREAQVQEEYARVAQELSDEEQEGKLQSGCSERFLEGDFTNETKDFLDKKIDYGQYRNNLNRLMKKHKEQRSCTFDVFTWK